MDMSPLPHKTPFSVDTDLDMDSPTTEHSMTKSQHLHPADAFQDSPFDGSRFKEYAFVYSTLSSDSCDCAHHYHSEDAGLRSSAPL